MSVNPSQSPSVFDRFQTLRKVQSEKFSRYFLLAILLGTAFIFFNMIKIFLLPILLAAVFTTLFYPLYKWLLKLFQNRKGLSSLVCCLILLLGLLVPVYMVADLVSREAVTFYQTAEQRVREIIQRGDEGLLGKIKSFTWIQWFDLDEINWQSIVRDIAGTAGTLLATVINKTSKGTFQIFANIFITLFIMYYFFMDGDAVLNRLKYLSPLHEEYENAIVSRFISVSRATIKGTLLIGLMQGGFGALTLWICGVDSPALWGVVMVILSIIPMVGAWLVMHPAALIQIITGHIWQGITIFLVTILIISNIDNLLRPRLVGQEAGMHDLMIFFSTLGGISLFGVMGFIVGPVVAAFFLTILDIYGTEFKTHLDLAQNNISRDEGTNTPTPAENSSQTVQTN